MRGLEKVRFGAFIYHKCWLRYERKVYKNCKLRFTRGGKYHVAYMKVKEAYEIF